jgi:hypothetical protein
VTLGAEPVHRIDKGQGETALRMIREGETVRLYCKPCVDVVYSTVPVSSRTLRPSGGQYRLLLNGEAVDVAAVYVDDGYGDGWENLATLLGIVVEGVRRDLPAALDEDTRLSPHAGHYAGTVGEAAVKMELVLRGRKLTGSYVHDGGGPSFKLLGTSYNATRQSETLALIERDAGDRVTATLRGELDAVSGTFTGTHTSLDGAHQEPFRLSRASPP